MFSFLRKKNVSNDCNVTMKMKLAYFWLGINCNIIFLATGQLNGNGFTNHNFKRDKSVYFPNNREILPPATYFCFLSKSFYPLTLTN